MRQNENESLSIMGSRKMDSKWSPKLSTVEIPREHQKLFLDDQRAAQNV
jgi:hypothetical protein